MELCALVPNTHINRYEQGCQGVQSSDISSILIFNCDKEKHTTHMDRAVNNIVINEGKLNDEEVCLTQICVSNGIYVLVTNPFRQY